MRFELDKYDFQDLPYERQESLRRWVAASGIYPFDDITRIVVDFNDGADFYVVRFGFRTSLSIPAMPQWIADWSKL